MGGIEDVSCWIVTDTIDSALVSAVVFSLSASEGLSFKNRSPKLRSFARCCREDKVPIELAEVEMLQHHQGLVQPSLHLAHQGLV
uniref:Uncharacterized protein n=1 Tax=Tanacetum cinerariifolium TaxID=118510 RepID=A0A699V1L1_TANCI|nr:hypothetical protein [Tanacetum cinerariifolium]